MPLEGEYVPSPSDWVRNQVELFERTQGSQGNTMKGLPVVVLTTVGARSGSLRKTPVMRVEHDGRYVAVASKGGAPDHPSWYANIVAHPVVELQDGSERRDYRAEVLAGPGRAEWWDRAVAAFPDYAAYQERTEREIPVVLLTPVEAGTNSG